MYNLNFIETLSLLKKKFQKSKTQNSQFNVSIFYILCKLWINNTFKTSPEAQSLATIGAVHQKALQLRNCHVTATHCSQCPFHSGLLVDSWNFTAPQQYDRIMSVLKLVSKHQVPLWRSAAITSLNKSYLVATPCKLWTCLSSSIRRRLPLYFLYFICYCACIYFCILYLVFFSFLSTDQLTQLSHNTITYKVGISKANVTEP